MDRLTTRDSNNKFVMLTNVNENSLVLNGTYKAILRVQDAFERLAQYEDTGLTPEQVKTAIELLKVHSIPISNTESANSRKPQLHYIGVDELTEQV